MHVAYIAVNPGLGTRIQLFTQLATVGMYSVLLSGFFVSSEGPCVSEVWFVVVVFSCPDRIIA